MHEMKRRFWVRKPKVWKNGGEDIQKAVLYLAKRNIYNYFYKNPFTII